MRKVVDPVSERAPKNKDEFHLFQLLPNMLTIAAICAGMTAIRVGADGNTVLATQLILAAAIIDGLDGRLARMLDADTTMGAELDSLADFLNFGVAPPLVIYFWALQDMRSLGWIAVLIYGVCCVTRLARFNVGKKSDEPEDDAYFTGVPSPAGAMMVLLPIFLSFALGSEGPALPDAVISVYMVGIGLLFIMTLPTWSFKAAKISRENVKYFLVAFACVGAAFLTYAWITMVVLCLAYAGVIIWSLTVGRPAK